MQATPRIVRSLWSAVLLLAALLLGACGPVASAPAATPSAPPKAAAAAPSVAPAATAAPSATPAPIALQFGTLPITAGNWPFLVANEKGFYQAEGLNLDTSILDSNTITAALLSGSVDLAFASNGVVLASGGGSRLVAVGSGTDRAPYPLLARPEIKSFADLRGKTLALLTPSDVYTPVVKDVLHKNGLDPDADVDVIYTPGTPSRMAALEAGGVHATIIFPPADYALREKGYNELAFLPDYAPRLQLSLVAARREWAEQNGEALRRFLRAHSRAITWLNTPANRDEAIAILAAATKLEPAAAAHAYEQLIVRAPNFPNDGCIGREGMENLLKILRDNGQLSDADASVDRYIDRRWCAG